MPRPLLRFAHAQSRGPDDSSSTLSYPGAMSPRAGPGQQHSSTGRMGDIERGHGPVHTPSSLKRYDFAAMFAEFVGTFMFLLLSFTAGKHWDIFIAIPLATCANSYQSVQSQSYNQGRTGGGNSGEPGTSNTMIYLGWDSIYSSLRSFRWPNYHVHRTFLWSLADSYGMGLLPNLWSCVQPRRFVSI
jgi:hypothetical protein